MKFIVIRLREQEVFDHSIVFEAENEKGARRRYMSHVFGIPYDNQTEEDTEDTFKRHNVDVVPLNDEWSDLLKGHSKRELTRSSPCRV